MKRYPFAGIKSRLLRLLSRSRKCGARWRDGHTCKRRAVAGRTRCPNHGGLSTGPRTAEGRARIAESNRLRAAQARAIGG